MEFAAAWQVAIDFSDDELQNYDMTDARDLYIDGVIIGKYIRTS